MERTKREILFRRHIGLQWDVASLPPEVAAQLEGRNSFQSAADASAELRAAYISSGVPIEFDVVPTIGNNGIAVAVDLSHDATEQSVRLSKEVIYKILRVWIAAGGELDLQRILDKKG